MIHHKSSSTVGVLLFFVSCMLYMGTMSVGADLASDRAALLELRKAVGGRPRLWNTTADSPCGWTGVYCDNNRVVMIRFPGMALSGQLPVGTLGNLTSLHTMSLRFNALTGILPPDIANLSNLRYLYLQGNSFSGDIPPFLFTLQNLLRLNLANNNFSGEISGEFNKLTRLGGLYLEQNNLSGSIPELNLPSLVQFNVSFNQLTGRIPSSLSGFPTSAFNGNSLCGKPLQSCNGEENGKKLSGGAIAGIVIGSVIGLLVIVMILILLCRRRSNDDTQMKNDVVEAFGGSVSSEPVAARAKAVKTADKKSLVFFGNASRSSYDFEDLLKASAEVLGKGTFGTTYKAVLDIGDVVAVKRLKDVIVPEDEFREQIDAVGAMKHENLVTLRAYFYSRGEKLLVYDYMPVGSLSALLHGRRGGGRTPLSWETRSAIALGAARGIAFLHSQGPETSHGNIKSSNILLTASYEARVSDFCLARLASPTSIPNRIAGYRAPEVMDSRNISQKADVYSFGVFLLELLTGKAPTNAAFSEEGVDLPRWVHSVVKDAWMAEVFDVELLRYQDVENDMVKLLQLAIESTAQYPASRPSMADVASRIEEISSMSPLDIVDTL